MSANPTLVLYSKKLCFQVSRIAYEIMQTRFPDAADRFKSLDDIWYFGGQGRIV